MGYANELQAARERAENAEEELRCLRKNKNSDKDINTKTYFERFRNYVIVILILLGIGVGVNAGIKKYTVCSQWFEDYGNGHTKLDEYTIKWTNDWLRKTGYTKISDFHLFHIGRISVCGYTVDNPNQRFCFLINCDSNNPEPKCSVLTWY